MAEILFNILNIFKNFSLGFFDFIIANIFWFKFGSGIISLLMVAAILYINLKLNLTGEKIEHWANIIGAKKLSRRRSLKAWEQIKKRLAVGGQNNYKMAILEADRVLDEILKINGVMGQSIDERLKLLTPDDLSNINEIRAAHEIKHRILGEPDLNLGEEEVRRIIGVYKSAFEEYDLL